jgi:hypothetical protein
MCNTNWCHYNRVQLYMLDTTFNFLTVSMFNFWLSKIDVKFILSYICDLSVYLLSHAIRTHIVRNYRPNLTVSAVSMLYLTVHREISSTYVVKCETWNTDSDWSLQCITPHGLEGICWRFPSTSWWSISKILHFLTLKVKEQWPFDRLVTIFQSPQRFIPVALNLQHKCCEMPILN